MLSGDPLKLLGALNQVNQLKLFEQTYNSRKAVGEATQEAIQPDGSIDTVRLMHGIKNRPDAGFGAAEAAAGALSRQGQQIQNTTAQYNLDSARNQNFADKLSTLADKKGGATDENLRDVAATWARVTKTPPEDIAAWLRIVPKDPEGRRQSLNMIRNMVLGAAGTSTPSITGIDPETGQERTGTKGQLLQDTNAPLVPKRVQTETIRPTGVITTLPKGQAEAMTAVGKQSGDQLAADRQRAASYRQQVFPLETAIPALERLGKTGTGPGTEEFNKFKSFLQSSGVGDTLGINVDKIKDFDEAKKYLTDWVNQNGNAGTNDKLAAAFAGSPSVGISNAASVDVAKSALSLRRMEHAKVLEFEKTGLPESKYANWVATTWQKQDPRAYGADMMGPDKMRQLLGSLKGAERERFISSLRIAHDNELTRPGE